ncbi:MAG: hypothetical protein SV765_02955 [Pseudomonadota bacterium]|nr:hypothetical protein [Pseudomonadota bacterium]
MGINLYPRKILSANILIIIGLLCLNILGILLEPRFEHSYVDGVVKLVDFNSERNVPTLFSTLLLLIASTLLFIIAVNQKAQGGFPKAWLGLSLIFLFLGVDEISSIHEHFTLPAREAFGASGLFYFAWVIPYGVALLILAAVYFRFLMALPKPTLVLFIISGVVFVSGAIGFEMLGGRHDELTKDKGTLHQIYYTCEELLEMLGVAIFIYALLRYIVDYSQSLVISISRPQAVTVGHIKSE